MFSTFLILANQAGQSPQKSLRDTKFSLFHFFGKFLSYWMFSQGSRSFYFFINTYFTFFPCDHHALWLIPFSRDIATYACTVPANCDFSRSENFRIGWAYLLLSRGGLLKSFHLEGHFIGICKAKLPAARENFAIWGSFYRDW